MSSVVAEKTDLVLPSDVLNRTFDEIDTALFSASTTEEAAGSFTAHAVFVGNIGLLLPGDQISELVDQQAVCRLPNTAIWFNGVTSVRGNMVPVFDLHSLFDIDSETETRRMIVVGEHETAVAFWVDDFPRLVSLSDEDGMTSRPPIPSMIKDHAHRYYLRDNQIWVTWNVGSFFETLGEMV